MGLLSEQPGGLNRYVEGLCGALRQGGGQADLMVACDGEKIPPDVRAFARRSARLSSRLWGARRAMRRRLAESPVDVVATHFALYGLLCTGMLSRRPHVLHFHGPWADEGRQEGGSGASVAAKRWAEGRVYRTADRAVVLSTAFGEVLASRYGFPAEHVRVIPGGVDTESFNTGLSREAARERLGWSRDRPTVFCIRRLVQRMGLQELVSAVAMVRERCPQVRVVIGGRGALAATLQAQIDALGLANHVELLGFVEEKDLSVAFRAADVSVVPSKSLEGFGLIAAESLAAGTPVLVTPVGGLPEVVESLDASLVMAGTDSRSIAEALTAALMDPARLPASRACQAYARETFDWSIIAGRVSAVYREAMAAHG